MTDTPDPTPEYNVTGIDFSDRRHLCYAGPPLIDVHCHITLTRPPESPDGPPRTDVAGSLEQAELLLQVGADFGVDLFYTMCPVEDIPHLRQRFGSRLRFNGSIAKGKIDEPDAAVFQRLDRFLAEGVQIIKFWGAPRGRARGLFLDAPWRIEAARRARATGVRVVMVHVADPDTWFQTIYADASQFGTKADQYLPLQRLLEEFPDLTWIAAHMGGDVEHPDHLEALLERYPHLYFDTSATKWQVREASARPEAVRGLMCRHPGRFLFGSDLVTRHALPADHHASRYWCHRTLWESNWQGPSPIDDPDFSPDNPRITPLLRGLDLPEDVLRQVYHDNAVKLFGDRVAEGGDRPR